MSAETQVYVSVIVLVLYICFSMLSLVKNGAKKIFSNLNQLFLCYIVHSVALLVSCAVDYSRSSIVLEYISCIVYTITGYLALYSYGNYFVETCEAEQKALKPIRVFNALILVANLAVTLPLIPSGLFFYVTPECVYVRGPLFYLSYLFVVVEFVVLDLYAVFGLKNRRKAFGYLLFGTFPLLVSTLLLFLPLASPMIDFSTAISCMILYFFVSLEDKEKALENETKLTKYKTDIMLSQIGPHFIYNTLSTISALCTIDPQKAQNLSADFTDYLRSNLNLAKSQRLSTFDVELNHTQKYIEIEKIRFGDQLHVAYEITETRFMLPSLSLQPIVENAVKHGITKKRNGGTVTIKTEKRGRYFAVIVSDDGVGFDAEHLVLQEGHYGIANTAERLKLMLDGNLVIESKEGVGTTVTMLVKDTEGNQ